MAGEHEHDRITTHDIRPHRTEAPPDLLAASLGATGEQQNKEVQRYSLSRISKASSVKAVIWLYDDENAFARLQFDTIVGKERLKVWQYPWGLVLNVPFHHDAYQDVVDILRNESPVHLTFHLDDGYARLSTGDEPAGEGEIAI
jgi:hypothetical protein